MSKLSGPVNLASRLLNAHTQKALPHPIQSQLPAAEGSKPEGKAFTLLTCPREGIPLQNSGRDTDVVVADKLYEPTDRKIYDWSEIKTLGPNFNPPLKDVCRVVVYNKPSQTRHFMLCVATRSNPKKLINGAPYAGELFHPLSLKWEMELLQHRSFNNKVRFTNEASALKRIATYTNRFPCSDELAEEGFISDHHAVKKLPEIFKSHDSFVQQEDLLFEEEALYCPTDKLNMLNPRKGEQVAYDELAPEQEEGEEEEAQEEEEEAAGEEDEPPANDAPADGEGEDGWVSRPPAKKAKAPPVPAAKKKTPVPPTKKPARELAEDPVEDDQGSTPKIPITLSKLRMVKNNNPSPEAEPAAAVAAPPKAAAKRAPKTVSRDDLEDVVKVIQKQEARRMVVSEEPKADDEEDEPAADAEAADEAEKIVPLAAPPKKAAPKAKPATPKMPPKKKDEAAPTAVPTPTKRQAPKAAPAPVAEESTPSRAKAKKAVAEAPPATAKRASPSEEPAAKRVKQAVSKGSGANGKAHFGIQVVGSTISQLKEAEPRIPPKYKATWMARSKEFHGMLSERRTFKNWLVQINDWIKQNSTDHIETIVLTLEYICREEGLKELNFGLVETRCAAVKNAKTIESRLAATQTAAKVLEQHLPMVNLVSQLLEQEHSLITFLHTAVGSDVALAEPFLSLFAAAKFKLGVESEEPGYLKSLNALMSLAYCVLDACDDLYPRGAVAAAEEAEPEAEEEEAAFELF